MTTFIEDWNAAMNELMQEEIEAAEQEMREARAEADAAGCVFLRELRNGHPVVKAIRPEKRALAAVERFNAAARHLASVSRRAAVLS